jgi:hypothetical protein
MTTRAMSIIVHGDSKAGKSTLGATTPTPRLLIDAEAAHRFLLQQRQVMWDPVTQAPPVDDGSWDTAVVIVRDYTSMSRAYEWLNSGQHPFKSVVVDSITEIQVKLKEQLSGDPYGAKMNFDVWGQVLGHMEKLLRDIRDLTVHPTNPLEAIVITAMTHMEDGKWRPLLQGQSRKKAPYFFDVIGYMYVELVYDPNNPAAPPQEIRRMLVGFDPTIIAGERVGGRLSRIISNPNVVEMLDAVFGPKPVEAVAAAPTE